MGYQTLDQNISFAEVALASSMENNRSLKMMEKVNQIIDWSHVETLLMGHYQAGTSKEGADAYSPLMLLKGLLLQKWFRLPSDPELEIYCAVAKHEGKRGFLITAYMTDRVKEGEVIWTK